MAQLKIYKRGGSSGITESIFAVTCNLGATNLTAGQTAYAPLGSQATFNTNEATRNTVFPFASEAYKFKIRTSTAQPATGSCVFNLRDNGTNVSTITIPSGSAAGTFGSNQTANFAEDDLITIQGINNASSSSATIISASVAFRNT